MAIAGILGATATLSAQFSQAPAPSPEDLRLHGDLLYALGIASLRLPLAGCLGAALAFRPKRPGTPDRSISVIETQIILAIVGALIMLVVGASLARAFGIVGAANLIRYRAKIDNPKDAVVMLSALAVGLACGVGLYVLAIVGTLFVGAALWIIEGFEPEARKSFGLKLTVKKESIADLRPQIESVLRRSGVTFELRGLADEGLSYAIDAAANLRVDWVSAAIEALAPDAGIGVEWEEKKVKRLMSAGATTLMIQPTRACCPSSRPSDAPSGRWTSRSSVSTAPSSKPRSAQRSSEA